MVIIEKISYKKSVKKILKNKTNELNRLENIKNIIIMSNNLHEFK